MVESFVKGEVIEIKTPRFKESQKENLPFPAWNDILPVTVLLCDLYTISNTEKEDELYKNKTDGSIFIRQIDYAGSV